MKLFFHKNFERKYSKLRVTEKRKFKERIGIFCKNPFHPLLNNHALVGAYEGSRSINVTGDLRAVYNVVGRDAALFVDIDTHSNLYG